MNASCGRSTGFSVYCFIKLDIKILNPEYTDCTILTFFPGDKCILENIKNSSFGFHFSALTTLTEEALPWSSRLLPRATCSCRHADGIWSSLASFVSTPWI